MELNISLRILVFILLASLFYIFIGKKDRYLYKKKGYLFRRMAIMSLIVLSPLIVYFIILDTIGIVVKFYVVFFLSVSISAGLILFFIMEKRKKRKEDSGSHLNY